jgi:DNA-binding MarR family transcriptional regulator
MYNRLLNNRLYILPYSEKGSEKVKEKVKKLNAEFKKYHFLHHEIIDAKFREHGLGFGQPPILKCLGDHENLTQKEIAEHLNVSQPAVAKALKKMDETGLIVRFENKKDTRCHKVKLTKKGKELVEYADNLFLRIDDVAYKGFTEEEMDTLVSFLERMNNNLTAFAKEDENV